MARFSTNINKRAGIGFNVDYAYARGYYKNQNHSSIDGSIYGYYRGDQYQAHGYYETGYIKNVENGGLQDERYITNPNFFPTRYGASDMPVRLEGVRNTVSIDRAFFTHRLSAGYVQYLDSTGREVHRAVQTRAGKADTDSAALKQLQTLSQDSTLVRRFVPVASLIHTLRAESNYRNFTSRKKLDDFFANFFTNGDAAADSTHYLSVQNTLALEMNEGFKKWVKTGMRLFAKHEFARFTLPDVDLHQKATIFNYFTVGAQLLRENAHTLRYNVLGEMRTTGKDWGEFNVEGNIGLHFRMAQDTLALVAGGFVRNESPAFYYNHYHGRNAWWDKDLNHVFRALDAVSISEERKLELRAYAERGRGKYVKLCLLPRDPIDRCDNAYLGKNEIWSERRPIHGQYPNCLRHVRQSMGLGAATLGQPTHAPEEFERKRAPGSGLHRLDQSLSAI